MRLNFLRSIFEPSPRSVVAKVRALEERWRGETDEALRARVAALRARLAPGGDGAARPLEAMAEVFACVALAAHRALGLQPFDVQLQGAVELARGRIVEMKTGEGKTLVATMPATLHALSGKGVHLVTVNDYLARRDADWMGPVYRLLGLSVGCIQETMAEGRAAEIPIRRAAYAADVTYVTNSELVFDSLRDNLARSPEEVVQRGCYYAIVDEADLLLIDEAQTPLIISGPGQDDPTLIQRADAVVRELAPGRHFVADHRARAAYLTEGGLNRVQDALGVAPLWDPANLPWAHAVYQSLQAHGVYERDVQYIVEDGEIHIVDEHTGRVSPEKRYSNGLHQALEAKEGVAIKSEDLTLAKTSYQYFFRGYSGLAGMTGTAWTARDELRRVYRLKAVRVPTHRPMIREDYARAVYASLGEKHDAAVAEILEAREAGRPVLVGTVSVEESEALSSRLAELGVPHEVLNARHHRREAEIVAQAGRPGAVTISTNMAGRGTDIKLGGADEAERDRAVAAGGLLVIGTGEHESVRIDNQLRGRAGRQGDPGASVYLVSIEDPVYRRFGQKKALPELRDRLADHPDGEPVTDPAALATLDALRHKVEVENQAIRLDVFKYDSVVHERRETIWGWRRSLLLTQDRDDWAEHVGELVAELVGRLGEDADREAEADAGDAPPARRTAQHKWSSILRLILAWLPAEALDDVVVAEPDQVTAHLMERYRARLEAPAEVVGALIEWERQVLLAIIDTLWPQYLNDLERVEEGIWMRGYAERDPFVEFRKEAAVMFGQLMRDLELDALRAWLSVEVLEPDQPPPPATEVVPGVPSPAQRKKIRR